MFLEVDPTDAHLILAALATRLRVLGDLDPKRLQRRIRQSEEGERIRALTERVYAALAETPAEGKVAGKHEAGSGV